MKASSSFLTVGVLFLGSGFLTAAEPEKRAVGKLVSAAGTVLQRGKPGEDWKVVQAKGELYAGHLLLGMPGAVVENNKGTIRLTFLTDFDKNSPYPILEAA